MKRRNASLNRFKGSKRNKPIKKNNNLQIFKLDNNSQEKDDLNNIKEEEDKNIELSVKESRLSLELSLINKKVNMPKENSIRNNYRTGKAISINLRDRIQDYIFPLIFKSVLGINKLKNSCFGNLKENSELKYLQVFPNYFNYKDGNCIELKYQEIYIG